MSKKQVHRPWLLKALMAGRVTNRQAAPALRLSVRQVQRLKGRYRAGGVEALQHGNRGRPSSRRLTATVRSRVQRLMQVSRLLLKELPDVKARGRTGAPQRYDVGDLGEAQAEAPCLGDEREDTGQASCLALPSVRLLPGSHRRRHRPHRRGREHGRP